MKTDAANRKKRTPTQGALNSAKAGAGSQQRLVILRLTVLEATMLHLVVGNGWGDGDFEEWLNEGSKVAACKRAMAKLFAAIREQDNERR